MILELGISGMTWSWEIFLVEISSQKLLIPSLSAQEGVQFVCSNLSPSVTRLCLASCGMSVTGAAAVAKMLRSAMVARVQDMKGSIDRKLAQLGARSSVPLCMRPS